MQITFSDGSTMRVSQRDYWNRNGAFQKRCAPTSFMRCGRYAVAIGRDLAISREFADDGLETNFGFLRGKSSAERWRSLADRQSQRNLIAAAIECFPQHPLAADLTDALLAEDQFFRGLE